MSAEWNTVDAYLAEKLLADDPALDATAIQTVGAKGWDGLMMALVR